jgi:polysaccharide export outer membrane protein
MELRRFAALAGISACLLLSVELRADEGLKLSHSLSEVPAAEAAAAKTVTVPATVFPNTNAPVTTVPAANSRAIQPRVAEYRIGTEDLIEVQVFGVDQLTRTVRVDSRGIVSLPLIGLVEVAGLTIREAQAAITTRLAESYLQNPQVSVFIKEFTTQRVTVEGAVARPGIYPLKGQATLLTAIALAGGQGRFSEMNEVVIFRTDSNGTRVATKYDVERIRRGEVEDPAVVNEDLVVVNRSPGRVAIRDSFLGDVFEIVNPFRYVPAP